MDEENLILRRRGLRIYVLTSAGTAAWLAALLAAPFFQSLGWRGARFLYACFAPVCHQDPGRTIFLWGAPLAVCARCLGIYLGFGLGLILYPFRRSFCSVQLPRLRSFIFASLPIAADFAANVLGLWSTPHLPRMFTGVIWGSILPFYFITGLTDLSARRISVKNPGAAGQA